jgi:DNA modification methylase
LRLEVADLATLGFDLPLMGFSDQELAALSTSQPAAGLTDPDAIPEAPVRPVTRPGDVWIMDRHRIICGDARDAGDVARLLDGCAINVAFTSPPYAEQREYDHASGFEPIPPDRYVEWFKPVAANVAHHLAPDGSWFVNIKPSVDGLDTSLYVFDLVIAHVREWGWHFATEFCWERVGVPKSVTQRFKNQFEPIYQFARGRWKMRPDAVRHESENVPRAAGPGVGQTSWRDVHGNGGNAGSISFGPVKKRRNGFPSQEGFQGTDWQKGAPLGVPLEHIGPGLAYPGNRLPTFTTSHQALGHAAAFPVGLPDFFCKAYADPGDVIYDPFCGTGSTIIAAQQTGCVGVGCDLSPIYVDVTVKRWQAFTGHQAVRADGRTFNELEEDHARTKAASDTPALAAG